MASISIADYGRTRPVEVDLWGHIFEYVPFTKSSESRILDELAAVDKGFAGEDRTKHAVQARLFASRMDIRLKKSPGGKKKASVLVREKWKADDFTMPQADQFWAAVEEAVAGGESGTTISIASFAAATVEVDLWGSRFEAIPVTCSTEPAIDAKIEEIERRFVGKELTHDVRAEIFGLRFDARLKPSEENEPAASELVRQKWEADEVEVPQLQQFWDAVLEAIDRAS
jgi:hypothetical protein